MNAARHKFDLLNPQKIVEKSVRKKVTISENRKVALSYTEDYTLVFPRVNSESGYKDGFDFHRSRSLKQ